MHEERLPARRFSSTCADRRSTAALVALAILPYLATLADPLFADDYLLLERAASRGGLLRAWVLPIDAHGLWWTPPGLVVEYFRPLVSVCLAVERTAFGLHAAGYHAVNLALHVGATLLVAAIARRLLGRGLAATGAGALFAVHPAHVQAVAWVSAQTDLLATVAGAGALLLHLDHRRGDGRHGAARLVAVGLLVGLALLAKEVSLTLPVLLGLDALLLGQGAPRARRLAAPAVAAVVALALFAARAVALGGLHAPPHPYAHPPGDPDFLAHLLLAPPMYLVDLVLFVPPDPVLTFGFWRAHPAALAALVALALAAVAGPVRAVRDRRVAAFAVGWVAVATAPVALVSPSEHFLYLPSLGYSLLLGAQLPATAAGLSRGARRAGAAMLALVAAVALARVLFFGHLARSARAAVDETLVALDAAPDARALLLVDLPAVGALFFPPAVRLERPGRAVDVEVLSVEPGFPLPAGPGATTAISTEGDALVLRRPGAPYLASAFERALPQRSPPPAAGDVIARPFGTITVGAAAPGGGCVSLTARARDPSRVAVVHLGAAHRRAPGRAGETPP